MNRRDRIHRQDRAGIAFVAPAMTALVILFALPAAAALLLALTDFDIYALANPADLRFVWFDNFARLADYQSFWRALGNTLLLAVMGVPASVGVSLGVALLLQHPATRWRGIWRVLLFAPYVTTLVATAIVWRYALGTRFGLVNQALGLVGIGPVDWLGDPAASMPAVALFITWKNFGYDMVLLSAALGAVPRDLVDAARIDGAGAWSRFRHVTAPAIAPMLMLAVLLNVAGLFQVFAEPYVMTGGGPAQSTVTLLYAMFDEAFTWWNLGLASALATVVFALTLLVTVFQVRLGRRLGWV